MYESRIKPACALAVLCWIVGWAVIFADLFTAKYDLGNLGIGVILTGAMVQIRGYYVSIRKRFDDHQLAFEMGKEIGQQSGIRPLR